MTKITVTSSGRTFCIDNHEATQGEYSQFLKDLSAWDPPSQYPPCAGLPRKPRELVISEQQPFDAGCPPGVFLPEMKPNQPVSCVSSCDAYAFCAWAGKRLCGGIDGGPIAPSAEQFGAALSNPTIHEWGYVCSSDGKYPGGAPTTDQCVATKSGWKAPDYDATAPNSCVSPEAMFAKVYNVTGGMSEWLGGTYAKQDGATFAALVLSGADGGIRDCGSVALTAFGAVDGNLGIRCCAD